MHLRHLKIQDCKLMRRLEVPFVRADGTPRLWTVFVGENGTCKTTLLRTIAISAAGTAFANNLVGDPASYIDLRSPGQPAKIDTCFGFSAESHDVRIYPSAVKAVGQILHNGLPAIVSSKVEVGTTSVKSRAHYGEASVEPSTSLSSPIDDARELDLPHWFVAGYGVGRILSAPQSLTEGAVPKRDRMKSLFDARHLPLGTAFSDRLATMFGEDRARAFAKCLRDALVDHMHTPRLSHIELRGQGGASSQINLIESHRFAMKVGGEEVKLPAVWLSQGYQSVISLVADIIGNVWLEAGKEVKLADMEGIVLVDELDLHLHPTWQTTIVAGLKATFPRMQFIVTTHSPLVLAGCRADEVWMLEQDAQTGDVTARPSATEPMLLTGSELNSDFFGVERVSAASEELRHYVELASNPYRSDAEDAEAVALRGKLRGALGADFISYEPAARKTAS
jgi:AAA domain, putative AbiEii toxin, Type IV TA system